MKLPLFAADILAEYRFFSAVCARRGGGEHNQPVNPDRLMIRGRVRAHLESLKQRSPDLLGGCDVREHAGSDYAFRFFVEKHVWVQVVDAFAEETDYDNFKDAVAHHQGRSGIEYGRALHDVWSVMYRLQEDSE